MFIWRCVRQNFYNDIVLRELRTIGLPVSKRISISLAVLTQYRNVTDGKTDRRNSYNNSNACRTCGLAIISFTIWFSTIILVFSDLNAVLKFWRQHCMRITWRSDDKIYFTRKTSQRETVMKCEYRCLFHQLSGLRSINRRCLSPRQVKSSTIKHGLRDRERPFDQVMIELVNDLSSRQTGLSPPTIRDNSPPSTPRHDVLWAASSWSA